MATVFDPNNRPVQWTDQTKPYQQGGVNGPSIVKDGDHFRVTGTDGDDDIAIGKVAPGKEPYAIVINDKELATLSKEELANLEVDGGRGSDTYYIDGDINVPVKIHDKDGGPSTVDNHSRTASGDVDGIRNTGAVALARELPKPTQASAKYAMAKASSDPLAAQMQRSIAAQMQQKLTTLKKREEADPVLTHNPFLKKMVDANIEAARSGPFANMDPLDAQIELGQHQQLVKALKGVPDLDDAAIGRVATYEKSVSDLGEWFQKATDSESELGKLLDPTEREVLYRLRLNTARDMQSAMDVVGPEILGFRPRQ